MVCGRSARGQVWAWYYMTGTWPRGEDQEVDHINGDVDDNRWENLRLGPIAINRQNQRRAHKRKQALPLGVCAERTRFVASITVSGVKQRIGAFSTPEQAHAAYVEAKRRLHPGNTL